MNTINVRTTYTAEPAYELMHIFSKSKQSFYSFMGKYKNKLLYFYKHSFIHAFTMVLTAPVV